MQRVGQPAEHKVLGDYLSQTQFSVYMSKERESLWIIFRDQHFRGWVRDRGFCVYIEKQMREKNKKADHPGGSSMPDTDFSSLDPLILTHPFTCVIFFSEPLV